MYREYKVVCIIPARGGSKGLPGKNIKELNGKPLIGYSIEQAKESKYIDRVMVSTDDRRISNVAVNYGAEVPFCRPAELARDNSGTIEVLLHSINWLEEEDGFTFDILVLLHVTAPFRTVGDIDRCIELLVTTGADNIFSVTEAHRNPYFNMVEVNEGGKVELVKKGTFWTRQSAPKVYDLNASIYVWWKDVLKQEKKTFLKRSRIYVMPKERSLDIDDGFDFKMAEFLQRSLKE